MATNPYFTQGIESEQNLFADLILESIQIYGQDMLYLPKTTINEKRILGEQSQAVFYTAIPIEMFLETYDGFEGEGNLFAKFGIEIRDQMKLIVAKRRWDTEVRTEDYPRPFEGDLIYHPLSRGLFQVSFVEHEIPYYQLNDLPVHKLTLELFEYNGESFETEIPEVDSFEILYGSGGISFDVELLSGSSPVEWIPNEIYQNVDEPQRTMKLYGIYGENDNRNRLLFDYHYYDDADSRDSINDVLINNKMKTSFGQIKHPESLEEGQIFVGKNTMNRLRIEKIYDITSSQQDNDFFPQDSEANNVTIQREAEKHIVDENNKDNPFGFI